MPIFSEIKILGETSSFRIFVLKALHKWEVVYYWSLQDVKHPLSSYH